MSQDGQVRLTTLIGELRHGNDAAREELVTLVYPELRRIAARYMRQERPGHTLRTTGLVNEMYVRLFGTASMDWQSRAHFFAAVAREMRHILVDHARARDAKKRPDHRLAISLSQVDVPADEGQDLLALNEALEIVRGPLIARMIWLLPKAWRAARRIFARLSSFLSGGTRETGDARR